MAYNPKEKLEPRAENEPKFNIHNKTDRKIFIAVLVSVTVLTIILAGLFIIYFTVIKGWALKSTLRDYLHWRVKQF